MSCPYSSPEAPVWNERSKTFTCSAHSCVGWRTNWRTKIQKCSTGAQKYKSVPPAHKNNCSIRLSNIKYSQQPTIRRLQKGYGKIR